MDILHVTHQYAPETRGGVESYVRDVAAAQHANGRDVQVLTGSHAPWPEPGLETLREDGIAVHRLHRDDLFFDLYSKAWHPGVGALLEAFLRAHRPRVVHVHQWIRLTSNLVELVQRCGIAAVVTLHDYYASCPRAFRLRPDGTACTSPPGAEPCGSCVPRYGHETARELHEGIELFAAQSRAELTMADAVLVGVSSTAELVGASLGLPPSVFRVLGLGYRRRFPGLAPLRGPAPGGPFRFAFWGGVAPHKGVVELVQAFASLVRQGLPRAAELHVLGGFATPGLEQQLRALAHGLPVVLHGPFRTEALRELDPHVGVFPSICLETFGIVLDECFELGLPGIVSDRGALAVRAGNGGLRVAAGDVAALAAAMRRFLDEPRLWQELRAVLPALPPPVAEHTGALDLVYAEAAARRAQAGPPAPPITDARRAAFLLRQRESAMARLPIADDPR